MDIRKFFGGKSPASGGSAAPSATLGEFKKQLKNQDSAKSPEVKSPVRSSPRKSLPKPEATKTKSATKASKKTSIEDDDSVIALSQSPPQAKGKTEKPKKAGGKSENKEEKTSKAKAKHTEPIVAKPKEEKKKAFQLLDDDDVDMNDSDDDFVPGKHRDSPKKGGRKRGKKSAKSDECEEGDEEKSGDDEIVRKKAKVAPKKKRTTDEDSLDAEDAKPKKEPAKKKKDAGVVRVLDSDDEDEEDKEALKHERQQKAAMKRALKPDSHGLRNQDIAEVVSAVASHKPKEVPPKIQKPVASAPAVKEISAAAFFGTEPVKHHHRDLPAASVDSEPMIVDEKEQDKPSTPSPKKVSSAKPTPQGQSKQAGRKLSSTSSEEYVLHAPLSPKAVDNQSHEAKSVTPSKTPGKTVTTPQSAADRRHSNYFNFMNREPPKHLGEKELPIGGPTCLDGLSFVITGVLESFERDDLKAALEKMGARVVGSVSKKTSYVIVGRDAGPAKLDKIRELKVTQLDEDGLIELVKSKIGSKTPTASNKQPVSSSQSASKTKQEPVKKESEQRPNSASQKSPAKPVLKTEEKLTASEAKPVRKLPLSLTQPVKAEAMKAEAMKIMEQKQSLSQPMESKPASVTGHSGPTELWVEKYKPKTVKNIVGQQGDRSCVQKLTIWLKNWKRNLGVKPNMNPYATNPDGAGLKAALLSGPPGVGKTTSAHLVCRELGISLVEMNASDTRSKKSLESWVSALLQSKSMDTCSGNRPPQNPDLPDHCLIMDEVDGMAGNEDRGGIAELIGLIKKSKIPVICICNDRSAQKIRSLANHCFDLRFTKPRPEQIKAAMMSMACREGVKIPPEFIAEVIEATNSDLRQVINQLQMFSSQSKGSMATYHARKDVRMGIFQLSEKIFGYDENKNMKVSERMELFFQDYSLVPLFVHENYAQIAPHRAQTGGALGGKSVQRKTMRLMAQAADSLSYGDVFERCIRSSNDWSLLSAQALLSCAIPSYLVSGHGRCNNFPGWFGKTSHTNKIFRVSRQLALHTSLATGIAGNTNFALDYVPALHRAVIDPLLKEGEAGVAKVIQVFEYYDLIREDLDALLEVDMWPNKPDEWKQVDSKVKASLTRQYNKSGHMTHYAMSVVSGGRKRGAAAGDGDEEMEGLLGEEEGSRGANNGDESGSDNDGDDPMVKATTGKGRGKAATSTRGAASAGRGGGRGSRGGRGAKK